MKRLTDWYAHPRYYEAIFGADTVREMDFLVALNRRYGTGGTVFLEPACGAGRLIAEGARRGLEMIGYDVSEAMLAYARARLRRRGLRARVEEGRMEAFAPEGLRGGVDLAFNLVSTFRYLETDEAAVAHLRSVRALLRPGGLYVLGFHLTDYRRRSALHERWVGQVGRDQVVCNTREWPPDRGQRRSRMRNRLRVRGPGKDWLIETEWYFRTYDERELERLLRTAGMRVMEVFDFEYRLDAPLPWTSDRLDRVLVLAPG
jgi:SAM-dependent methyltransferase